MRVNLVILDAVQNGVGPQSVTLGYTVTDPAQLPIGNVQGTIDWGDGTSVAIPASIGPLQASSNLTCSVTGALASLSYSGTPVGGEFNITYGSYSQTLAYNCTTPQLQSALTALLAPVSATAVVTGNPGSWAITFSSNTAASNFGASSTSLYSAIEVRHLYPGGIFVATASFTDFSSPTPNTAAASIMVNVSFSSLATSAAPVVFGPILPADQGFPNKNQWDFNFGQDLAVLVSSIKMLLNTEPGERIALPEYGCALRRKIFDQINDASTASDIQGDIQTAISNWEPRVGINNINVALNPSARSITVQLSLYSKLDQRNFQMEVEVERN